MGQSADTQGAHESRVRQEVAWSEDIDGAVKGTDTSEYPTPSGSLLPRPDTDTSVLEAISISTLKARRESNSKSNMASEQTRSDPSARQKESLNVSAVTTLPRESSSTGEGTVQAIALPDTTPDSERRQSIASSSSSASNKAASNSIPSSSSSRSPLASAQRPRSPRSPHPLHQTALASSSSSSRRVSENAPQSHIQGPTSDIRPTSLQGASFVPIKVKDFGFPDTDPRHVGARDVSLGASSKSTSRGPQTVYRRPDKEEWEEMNGDVGSSGGSTVFGKEGRWRSGVGNADDWGPGVSYDDDEEEFEGTQGRRGSKGNESEDQQQDDSQQGTEGAGTQPGLYEVIYDFGAESEHELTVATGDRVRVVASVEGGWAVGIREGDGKEGLVPEGYLMWVTA